MNPTEILIALRRITRAIDLHSKELQKSAGLTVPQLLVLKTLQDGHRHSVSEIARRISLSQATVTSIIERMDRKGLIRRQRDERDRRKVIVSLTETGKSRLEASPDPLQQAFMRKFSALEDWEQKLLTATVERIASMMDEEHTDAAPILQIGDITGPATPPVRKSET